MRGWPRYSLRQLLAATLVVALALAWWSEQARETRRLAATLRNHGVGVTYAVERRRSRQMGKYLFNYNYRPTLSERLFLQYLTLQCKRPEFFSHLDGATVPRGPLAREVRHCLQRLRGLSYLHVKSTDFGDDDLRSLSCSASLEWLDCEATAVTDAGAQYLTKFKHLKTLDIQGTRVTDRGLLKLVSLRRLETLRIGSFDKHARHNRISFEAVQRLKAALPGCAFAGSSRLPER